MFFSTNHMNKKTFIFGKFIYKFMIGIVMLS